MIAANLKTFVLAGLAVFALSGAAAAHSMSIAPPAGGVVAASSEAPQLVWDKKKQGIHCTTPKKACLFEDKKPRPLGTSCICRSQPKVKGKVTP